MNNSVNDLRHIDKAIKLEYRRQTLSKLKRYDLLEKTYKSKSPEIPNGNTGQMWDSLNLKEIIKDENPMAYDRITTVASYVKKRDIKLLDIGFGQGMLEIILNKRDDKSEVWGIDISRKSVIRENKKYQKRHWKFINSDIFDAHLPTGYFDYVTALEVLEHIETHKILDVLRKMNKLLKQNGCLIISVPLNEGLEDMLKKGENPNSHTRIYSPELIKAELELTNFKILQEKLLFAFENFYRLKSTVSRIYRGIRHPNNIIILANKK